MFKKQWTRFEKIWVVVFILAVVGATCYFSYTGTDYTNTSNIILNWIISPLSAITGIFCVVLVARGSIINYFPGFINAFAYGYIAYKIGYYGDMALNLFFFLPFQFIGYYVWKRNYLIPDSDRFVKMRKLTFKQFIIIAILGIVFTFAIGYGLQVLDGWFVTVIQRNVSIYNYIDTTTGIKMLGSVFDSSTEVLQILATFLMVASFREQWLMWILTNIITIIMWSIVIIADPTMIAMAVPTLVMWIAFLVNSIYGWYSWSKGVKEYV